VAGLVWNHAGDARHREAAQYEQHRDRRIQYQSADMARQAFEAEMHALLDYVNAHVAHHEQLRMIVVTLEPWSIENG